MQVLNFKPHCTLCEDGPAYVPSDLRKFQYQQMAQHVQPGVQISTKRAYQQLLKRKGLTDDVTHKELREMTVNISKRIRVREEKIRQWTNVMVPQLHQKLASWRR